MAAFKMFSNFTAWTALLQFVTFTIGAEQQLVLKDKPASPFDSKFAKLAKETLELWHVPGLSIAVVDGNDTWADVSFCLS
jgi:hypothetical protein